MSCRYNVAQWVSSGTRLTGFEYWFCHLLAVWRGSLFIKTILYISSLICKMEVKITPLRAKYQTNHYT